MLHTWVQLFCHLCPFWLLLRGLRIYLLHHALDQVVKWEGAFAVTEKRFLATFSLPFSHFHFAPPWSLLVRKFCTIRSCRPARKIFHLASRSQVIVHEQ